MNRRRLLQGLGGATALTFAPRAWAQGGQGRWLRLESPNFVYYSATDEAKSREELAALEGFHALLAKLMPRAQRSPLKLTIYNTSNRGDLEAAHPGMGEDVLGFYEARIEGIRAVSSTHRGMQRQRDMPRHTRAMDARTVLFHEYAHHHMRANNRLAYPAWYTEGYAEFLSTVEFTQRGADVGKLTVTRASWLVHGDWLPIDTFLTKHPSELKDGEQIAQFYAQSWFAAHYLFANPERAKGFDAYIRALLEGGDLIGAFQPAFGITPEQFDKELRDYKRKPINFWTIGDSNPIAGGMTVTRLGRSADDLLLPASYLATLPSRDKAKDTVARVREIAGKHLTDVYALQCKAMAEVWYGDLAEARKQIDALLPLSATADVHHLSGLCDLRAARQLDDDAMMQRAQNAFGRAHQLDEGRPHTMYRYVEAGLALTGMDEDLINVLVSAYQLAPQIDPIALTTAQALIEHDRFEEAVIVLRPLTAELHGEGMSGVARELTAMAKAERKGVFAFYGASMMEGD